MGRLGRFVQGGIGVALFVLVVWYFLGLDATRTLPKPPVAPRGEIAEPSAPAAAPAPGQEQAEDSQGDFVSTVLADTEDTWGPIFLATGLAYEPPNLVLFNSPMPAACSFPAPAAGPFYCPDDRKLFLDLDFLSELRERFPVPGDLAEAYVIAHEVGHHAQNLMGITKTYRQLLESASADDAVTIATIFELQADCYAGIWANHANLTRNILKEAGAEDALAAATAVGADGLQQQKPRGLVVPDSFTVGTPEQRLRWFRQGLKAGNVAACDTFTAEEL